MYKKNRASPSRQINPHTSSDIYIKMYAIVPMYFTHTYTHLYIKYTLKVLVICSICCCNWGFTFQSVIIMKTVEKENYDRLWQSFTERLEEGKNVKSKPTLPLPNKEKSGIAHSLVQKKESFTTVTTNVCACSIERQSTPKKKKKKKRILISSTCILRGGWLRRSK